MTTDVHQWLWRVDVTLRRKQLLFPDSSRSSPKYSHVFWTTSLLYRNLSLATADTAQAKAVIIGRNKDHSEQIMRLQRRSRDNVKLQQG